MISVKGGGGGENVRPETDEYTALLAEAISEIEGKAALGGDATAEDIREGKTAYVNGQLLEGLMEEGLNLLALTGYTKIAIDTFVCSSDEKISKQIPHSLGDIPKIVIILSEAKTYGSVNYLRAAFWLPNGGGYSDGCLRHDYSSTYGNTLDIPNGNGSYASTNAIVCAKPNATTDVYYQAGRTYTLITLA